MEENKSPNKVPEYNPFQIKPDVNPLPLTPEFKDPEVRPIEIKQEIKIPDIIPPTETKKEFTVFGAKPENNPEIKTPVVDIPKFKWEPKAEVKQQINLSEIKLPEKPLENKELEQSDGGVEFLNNENKPTPQPQQLAPNRVVRTFEADISQAMRDKKGSAIKIALAENKRRAGESIYEPPIPKKSVLFIALAGLLIISGFVALGYVYISNRPQPQNVVNGVEVNSIIPAEKHDEVTTAGLTQSTLIMKMMDEMSTYNMRLDTILDIYFTETVAGKKQKAGTSKFFEVLGSRIPQVLLRSLQENFMLGVHAFNGNQPFIILKTDFYENAFLGLLKWEQDMPSDLLPLFGTRITPENSYLIGKQFTDSTYKNKDVRVLLDKDNKIILIYAIPNRQTIIITTNEDTLEEVINRLNAPSAITQ